MKRYLFALGITLCAGHPSSAGTNESSIEQLGDGSVAEVSQSNAPSNSSNMSDIKQIGGGNETKVNQTFGTIPPILGDSGSNVSAIKQTGSDNQAQVNQAFDIFENTFVSSSNVSDITQSGAGNQAEVNQGNSGFANNESTIAQDGIANRASVMQTGSPGANGSVIEQIGEGQEAAVTQFASMAFFDGTAIMDSQIHQTGIGNRAHVNQSGQGSNSTIQQDGTNQSANVVQGAPFSGADSLITQSGADNTAHVEQTGAYNTHVSGIHVNGIANQTGVLQGYGGGGDFTLYDSLVDVHGNGNNVKVLQDAHNANDLSTVNAIGDGNTVLVDQRAEGSVATNTSEVLINGGANQISIVQNALTASNVVNSSEVHVDGAFNEIAVQQDILPLDGMGSDVANMSQIHVDGAANQITVVQANNAPAGGGGVNTSAFSTVGNGNVVTLTQQQ